MNLVEILKSDPLPKELAFAPSEYQRRVRAVQIRDLLPFMQQGLWDVVMLELAHELSQGLDDWPVIGCGRCIDLGLNIHWSFPQSSRWCG